MNENSTIRSANKTTRHTSPVEECYNVSTFLPYPERFAAQGKGGLRDFA